MRQTNFIRKFYVAYGTNGVGIFSTYYTAEHARKYLKKIHIKKIESFDRAEEFAFWALDEIAPLNVTLPNSFSVNQIVFVSHLMAHC